MPRPWAARQSSFPSKQFQNASPLPSLLQSLSHNIQDLIQMSEFKSLSHETVFIGKKMSQNTPGKLSLLMCLCRCLCPGEHSSLRCALGVCASTSLHLGSEGSGPRFTWAYAGARTPGGNSSSAVVLAALRKCSAALPLTFWLWCSTR